MPNSMTCTSPCLLLSAAVVATLRLMLTLNPLKRASCDEEREKKIDDENVSGTKYEADRP